MTLDLNACRERVMEIGIFLSAQDIQSAADAIQNESATPPAAFVSIASEIAEPNKIIGKHRQRVLTTLSILFSTPVARAADDLSDEVEINRVAVRDKFTAWTVPGSERALEYQRWQIRAIAEGIIWGEMLFTTTYQFTATPD